MLLSRKRLCVSYKFTGMLIVWWLCYKSHTRGVGGGVVLRVKSDGNVQINGVCRTGMIFLAFFRWAGTSTRRARSASPAWLALHARLALVPTRLKNAKNNACSAGYKLTPQKILWMWSKSQNMPTLDTRGFFSCTAGSEIQTWPKLETVLEKSLAPWSRVKHALNYKKIPWWILEP